RIALTRLSWQRPWSTGVLVRDAKSGRIRAFSAQGASLEVPIPAVPSATPAVDTGLGYPALLERDRIHYARHLDFRLPLLGVAATDWHSIAVERPPVLTAAQTDSVLMTVEDGGHRLRGRPADVVHCAGQRLGAQAVDASRAGLQSARVGGVEVSPRSGTATLCRHGDRRARARPRGGVRRLRRRHCLPIHRRRRSGPARRVRDTGGRKMTEVRT